jgi:hypothetical protein
MDLCARICRLITVAVVAVAPALVPAATQSDLMTTFAAMEKAGKFRTEAVTTTADGKSIKRSIEVQWPDRYHMVTEQMEVIIVPGKTYMKHGGAWQPFPVDMGKMIESLRADATKKAFEGTTNLREIGTGNVNGHAAQGYEYDSSSSVMGTTATSHVKLWVDPATRLPLRQEVDGEALGHKSHTVQDYQFDPAILIEAPL